MAQRYLCERLMATKRDMGPEAHKPGERSSETEIGMNIISADFDLIMVNRPNERLYGKPMVELLGKKCYREFEKRDEPCPHCPGRLSLALGGTHEAETQGIRDDGTWFSARVRTHPVEGLGDIPTAFVEVVEDITEEKRAEKLAAIESDLRSALASARNVRTALALTFQAALQVESIDGGCVLLLRRKETEDRLVVSRGLTPECMELFTSAAERPDVADVAVDVCADVADGPRVATALPIVHRGDRVAVMIVTSSTYREIPASLLAGLRSLCTIAANCAERIWAEQSRDDALSDLHAVIRHAPSAMFLLDKSASVIMWNGAAERLLGWRASEVLRRPCPVSLPSSDYSGPLTEEPQTAKMRITGKSGISLDVRIITLYLRGTLDAGVKRVVMIEDLTPHRPPCVTEEPAVPTVGSILVINPDPVSGEELANVLRSRSHEVTVCSSIAEATPLIAAAAEKEQPFALAVVELVGPDGGDAFSQRAALRSLGLESPVMVSSDSDVSGHEQHGFAGALKRPYDAVTVDEMVRRVWQPS